MKSGILNGKVDRWWSDKVIDDEKKMFFKEIEWETEYKKISNKSESWRTSLLIDLQEEWLTIYNCFYSTTWKETKDQVGYLKK